MITLSCFCFIVVRCFSCREVTETPRKFSGKATTLW